MKLENGEEVSVVFLDTEGFAANNVSENYDAKVFAVSTMLSSHLLYNSVKIIDQGDIDYLELLARRTQLFALRSQMSKKKWLDDFNEDLLTFPPLTWVVQDFFQDIADGETPREWLHRLMTTHTRENEHYDISILDIFKSVDCHTMFIPATKRSLLNDLSKATEDDLTHEYREERDTLVRKLTRELSPKKKQGRYLSGVHLAHLMTVLVTAANEGSLADVPSRWDAFVERLQLTATEDCHKFYEEEITSFITSSSAGGDRPVKSTRLLEIHEQMSSRADVLLDHLLQGLDEALKSGHVKLKQKIDLTFERTYDLNEKKIKLERNELSNEAEIKVEVEINKLNIPLPTSSFLASVNAIVSSVEEEVKEHASLFLEEKQMDEFLQEVSSALEKVVERLRLRNNEAIADYFKRSVNEAVTTFIQIVHSDWELKTPQKPSILQKMKENARRQSETLFLTLTKDFEHERPFATSHSHVRELVREEETKVDEENSQLVTSFIKSKSAEILEQFKQRTGPDVISLPVFDEELEKKLAHEINRIIQIFENSMVDFSIYPTFGTLFEEFKKDVSDLCDLRRRENLGAFTREVHKPLEAAKKIVTLSESKYSTVFSFKQFVRSVCLIHLDDGKPKSWPYELKLQIINNFIANDEDLISMINEKDGLWSTIKGLFEWILWTLGLIS